MTDNIEQFGPNPKRAYSSVLAEAGKESRNIEHGLLKIVLTVSGGALTLSIGFILGDRRVPFPHDLINVLIAAWISLALSMASALLAWTINSIATTLDAAALFAYLEGKRKEPAEFKRAGQFSTLLAALAGFACIVGLSMLAWIAVELASR
jgi:hypothetical protein